MKSTEAKAILKDRLDDKPPRDVHGGSQYVLELRQFDLFGSPAHGNLAFAKNTDELLTVSLSLISREDDCKFARTPQEDANTTASVTQISDKLIENYGRPVLDDGWPSASALLEHFVSHGRPIVATRQWKVSGQVITEFLSLACSEPYLKINYRPEDHGNL